jgi:hypothetical protein
LGSPCFVVGKTSRVVVSMALTLTVALSDAVALAEIAARDASGCAEVGAAFGEWTKSRSAHLSTGDLDKCLRVEFAAAWIPATTEI